MRRFHQSSPTLAFAASILECSCAILAGCVLVLGAPAVSAAETAENRVSAKIASTDWPWWRGPSRDGHAPDSTSELPTQFGPTENVLWKVPVPGRGHSSPIVVGQRVFLATADETQKMQSVLAFDLDTGKQLWKRDLNQGGFPANNHAKNTEASPTPASDGRQLYVTFFHHRQIELIALAFDGKIVWRKKLGDFNPKMFEYGYAPSPLLFGESVIVAAEHDGDSYLVSLDRESGSELWRTPRKPSISFSSPVVADVAGREQVLLSGQDSVTAYDPNTGKTLWQVAGTTAATCGTMIWEGDVVFASGGYPKAETLAIRADGSGQVLWKNNQKCYEQSMIVIDGFVYALTDKGILYCWRASDGQEQWRERLDGPVSSSPVYVGGHVYWANEAGTFYVFRPDPKKFQLVAQNRLGTEAFASPAVSGNRLLLRVADGGRGNRQEFLYCIGK